MPTDDPKTLLDKILRDWSLMDPSNGPLNQARRKALEPLQQWLNTGKESPHVVIRAVSRPRISRHPQ